MKPTGSGKKRGCLPRVLLGLFLTLLLGGGGMLLYVVFDNARVIETRYTYTSEKVPPSFDGYTVCLVTDFHNADTYERVAEAVRRAQPDLICLGGDMVDMNTEDFGNAVSLIRELSEIATVFYTYGNHEMWSTVHNGTEEPRIKEKLDGVEVEFLNNRVRTVYRGEECIQFIGYRDSIYDDQDGNFGPKAKDVVEELYGTLDPQVLSVLVFHRAQYFPMLAEVGYDVVLSGHLHGGHVNLPYAKDYILNTHFGTAAYSRGEYTEGDSTMFICGGTEIAEGIFRVFNTPEIVTVELKAS